MSRKVIRCVRCGRALRGRLSRYLGIGPSCARKLPTYTNQRRLELAGQLRLFPNR